MPSFTSFLMQKFYWVHSNLQFRELQHLLTSTWYVVPLKKLLIIITHKPFTVRLTCLLHIIYIKDEQHTIWSKACANSCLPEAVWRSVTIQWVIVCGVVTVVSAFCFFTKYSTPRLIMVAVLSRDERPENDSNVRGISSARGAPVISRYWCLSWFRIRSLSL